MAHDWSGEGKATFTLRFATWVTLGNREQDYAWHTSDSIRWCFILKDSSQTDFDKPAPRSVLRNSFGDPLFVPPEVSFLFQYGLSLVKFQNGDWGCSLRSSSAVGESPHCALTASSTLRCDAVREQITPGAVHVTYSVSSIRGAVRNSLLLCNFFWRGILVVGAIGLRPIGKLSPACWLNAEINCEWGNYSKYLWTTTKRGSSWTEKADWNCAVVPLHAWTGIFFAHSSLVVSSSFTRKWENGIVKDSPKRMPPSQAKSPRTQLLFDTVFLGSAVQSLHGIIKPSEQQMRNHLILWQMKQCRKISSETGATEYGGNSISVKLSQNTDQLQKRRTRTFPNWRRGCKNARWKGVWGAGPAVGVWRSHFHFSCLVTFSCFSVGVGLF